MSALRQENLGMSEEEYLDFERESETKHEFLNGYIYAMAGASRKHNLLCVSTTSILYNQLLDKPCEIYPSDMRVKAVASDKLYTYPDISIVCGEPQLADEKYDILLNPTVIIEVLSPTTEAYDRGKKFQIYRELTSLREYLLISQASARIEHYLLQDNGKWELTDARGLEASLELPSIGCTLALADVYRKVSVEGVE
jgi:Uma2 family endonuclease